MVQNITAYSVATSVLAVWLGGEKQHSACPYILSDCEGLYIGTGGTCACLIFQNAE